MAVDHDLARRHQNRIGDLRLGNRQPLDVALERQQLTAPVNQGDQLRTLRKSRGDQDQGCDVETAHFHRKVSCTCWSPRKTSTTNLGFSGSFFLGASSSLSFFSPVNSCHTRGSSRLGTLPRKVVVLPRRARAMRALIIGSSASE